MSRKWILLASAVFLFSSSIPALAEEQQARQADPAKTEIAVNEEAGTVSIMVDGKEVVRIDSAGLHVAGNIEFTGTIADIGSAERKDIGDAKEE